MSPFFWVVVGSAALTCFFAMAAYSLRAFRRSAWGEEAEGQDNRRRLDRIEQNLTPLTLTAALCRTLSNLVMLAALIYLLRPAGQEWSWGWTFVSLAIAVGIIAIFGVAVPNAWARYAGGQIVLASYVPLMAIRYLLYPLIVVMQALEVPVRRLAGAEVGAGADHVRQEIMQAATEGAAEGSVEHEEVEMIASVIEFGDRRAGEIMTPRTDLFALPVETTWAAACQAIYDAGHTRVPVYQGDMDNIIGVLYAKDLLHHIEREHPTDLRTIMRKAFFVPETKPLDDLLREFRLRKVHLAVVLDEYGGTAGIVTIEDVLEEIVGEISDEYDRAEPALMHRLDDNSAEVDGRMYTDDLNEAMRLHIPENQDYVTVAGLVFSELGYIPQAGETLTAHGARFTVLAADERKITRLKVERLSEQEDGEEGTAE